MGKNNLQIRETGLDACYLNGIPIVEAIIDINDVYKKVARISSLAVQADPYFNGHTGAQKLFSESHGEGDRITRDFLEEGARELLPIFSPLQRLIPEGTFDTSPVEYDFKGQTSDFSWTNPDPSSIFINSVKVTATNETGDITFVVDSNTLGTVTIPDSEDGSGFLSYDLAGYLGGVVGTFFNYSHTENTRNNNAAQLIELLVANNTDNFVFDVAISGVKYNAIGWIKALTEIGDVRLPSRKDDINVNFLINEFIWTNISEVRVNGAVVSINSGSAFVTILHNGIPGPERFIDRGTVGDDFTLIIEDTNNVSVLLREATVDFNYNLIINTDIPNLIPSPRFEFDSNWNKDKIIFRYQNMDTRIDKLNYTSETLKHVRVDPNIFEEVTKYLQDSLKNYVLKELYLAIGYDKKADEYFRKYEMSRTQAKFWVRSEKGLQTQYNYAGV